jgi:hypothetical protein
MEHDTTTNEARMTDAAADWQTLRAKFDFSIVL